MKKPTDYRNKEITLDELYEKYIEQYPGHKKLEFRFFWMVYKGLGYRIV